jgi:hypothetical protein
MKLRIVVMVVLVALLGALSASESRSSAQSSAQLVVTVGEVTTQDYRAVVLAHRLGGAPRTAKVRVGFARRVSGRWRELGERRLDETYFWRTVTGPRAVCRLEIETVGPGARVRPSVTVRLLLSPSIGCGNTYRVPLTAR